jgi:16S rRNA (cytosine1402-N4)-methyltransferase
MVNKSHNQAPKDEANNAPYHVPVMLQETIDALAIREDGVYVDCTFGGGGHAGAILNQLGAKGKLVAFDQDATASRNIPDDARLIFVPHNFRHLSRFLRLHKIDLVDGVLADLGVSSHQFDEAARGFSIRFDAPLDMRMDQRLTIQAADLIATCSELQLQLLFQQYGEVTNSKTLAKTIVALRGQVPLKTINQFKAAVQGVVKGNPNKYFAQVFQALRIEVNDEMGALKELLQQLPQVLNASGIAVFITFHSLEDRLVKTFFKTGSFEPEEDHPFENKQHSTLLMPVNKKPITASEAELKRNPRSRSAKLRIAAKKLAE